MCGRWRADVIPQWQGWDWHYGVQKLGRERAFRMEDCRRGVRPLSGKEKEKRKRSGLSLE
jgi:hypothetical protein